MNKSVLCLFASLLFLTGCEPDFILQQEAGVVTGRIYPLGTAATVGLYLGVVSKVTETTTVDDGTFRIEDVQPGNYYLKAKADGYGTTEISDIEIAAGSVTDVGEIKLSVYPWPITDINIQEGASMPFDGGIRIYFDQVMAIETIDGAITIEPEVENLEFDFGYYLGGGNVYNRFGIDIHGDWGYNTSYTLSIDKGLKTSLGRELEFTIGIAFTSERFKLSFFDLPYSNGSSVNLKFNGEISRSQLRDMISLQPEFQYYIDGSNISSYFFIRPAKYWPTHETVIAISGALEEIGGHTMGADATIIVTMDPIMVEDTSPRDGSIRNSIRYTSINIKFSTLFADSTAATAVSITPPIDFNLEVSTGNPSPYIFIDPIGWLDSLTIYTVTIDTSLHDAWGYPLERPYKFSFTTE